MTHLYISYFDAAKDDLKYAAKTNDLSGTGLWTKDTIDSAGDVGDYTSISVDSNNKIHISYFDAKYGNLRYATNVGGAMATYTIVETMNHIEGEYTSIAIDGNNKVHISYYDRDAGSLRYVTNAQ